MLVGLTASALVHLPAFDSPLSTVLYDRDGQLLSATVASDEQWRFAPPAALPEKFVHALLTFEDKGLIRGFKITRLIDTRSIKLVYCMVSFQYGMFV